MPPGIRSIVEIIAITGPSLSLSVYTMVLRSASMSSLILHHRFSSLPIVPSRTIVSDQSNNVTSIDSRGISDKIMHYIGLKKHPIESASFSRSPRAIHEVMVLTDYE